MKRLVSKKALEKAYSKETVEEFVPMSDMELEEEIENIPEEVMIVMGETIKFLEKGRDNNEN